MFLGARAESASGNWWMKEPQQQLCCSLQLQDEEGSGWFCAPRGEAVEGTTGSQHQAQGGRAPEELQGELSPPNPWAWDVETFVRSHIELRGAGEARALLGTPGRKRALPSCPRQSQPRW